LGVSTDALAWGLAVEWGDQGGGEHHQQAVGIEAPAVLPRRDRQQQTSEQRLEEGIAHTDLIEEFRGRGSFAEFLGENLVDQGVGQCQMREIDRIGGQPAIGLVSRQDGQGAEFHVMYARPAAPPPRHTLRPSQVHAEKVVVERRLAHFGGGAGVPADAQMPDLVVPPQRRRWHGGVPIECCDPGREVGHR